MIGRYFWACEAYLNPEDCRALVADAGDRVEWRPTPELDCCGLLEREGEWWIQLIEDPRVEVGTVEFC